MAEIISVLTTGSPALLADVGHMLADVAGLAVVLTAAHLSAHPTADHST